MLKWTLFFVLIFICLHEAIPYPQNSLWPDHNPIRFDKTTVTIRNEIGDPLMLRVHCRSKTEDTYTFTFQANQDTCYWCKLYRWKGENGGTTMYKMLIDAWGNRDCGESPSGPNQFWAIRDDGAHTDNVLKSHWLKPEEGRF